jgi:ATP-binding protein involved in chromosome partitioning
MFGTVEVPILGLVENMSHFVCEHGTRYNIFSTGGGRRNAEELGIPFVGEIPIEPAICEGGDAGTPVMVKEPDSAIGEAFREIARSVAANASVASMNRGVSQEELVQISDRREQRTVTG